MRLVEYIQFELVERPERASNLNRLAEVLLEKRRCLARQSYAAVDKLENTEDRDRILSRVAGWDDSWFNFALDQWCRAQQNRNPPIVNLILSESDSFIMAVTQAAMQWFEDRGSAAIGDTGMILTTHPEWHTNGFDDVIGTNLYRGANHIASCIVDLATKVRMNLITHVSPIEQSTWPHFCLEMNSRGYRIVCVTEEMDSPVTVELASPKLRPLWQQPGNEWCRFMLQQGVPTQKTGSSSEACEKNSVEQCVGRRKITLGNFPAEKQSAQRPQVMIDPMDVVTPQPCSAQRYESISELLARPASAPVPMPLTAPADVQSPEAKTPSLNPQFSSSFQGAYLRQLQQAIRRKADQVDSSADD
jgi:hypothetical protein